MSRVLVLPDIHGRKFWKVPCSDISVFDKVIFLGDYLDPYDFEGISIPEAIDNFKEIIEFKKNNEDKVVLLLGNHDFPYLSIDYYKLSTYHCRHSKKYHNDISKLFDDNRDQFMLAYTMDDILFTHAGVTDIWYDNFVDKEKKDLQDVCDKLNKLKDCPEKLYMVSYHRGGYDNCSSCIWTDIHELQEKIMSNFDGFLSKTKQIFGHTLQAYYDMKGEIAYGKPIEGTTYKMLDTTNAYVIDTEKFEVV